MQLLESPTKILFFTGKGGVGKTSLACAVAISLSDDEKRVLLVRVNGQRRATVSMSFQGQDLVGFVDRAQEAVRPILPGGYVTEWGGEFENFQRALARLKLLVPLVMLGILFFLSMNLKQWKAALVIYLNIPFAAVGGVFALAVRGMPFSISTGVGFLTLFGVAVLNGLVLMSAVQKESHPERACGDVLQEAATSRLRPVLRTALVASLGFLPMALSSGAGVEVQQPLATVVIGGALDQYLSHPSGPTLCHKNLFQIFARRRGGQSITVRPGLRPE